MRIFLAGATGALGMRLLPRLIAAGHEVTATTRTPSKEDMLRAAGATPSIVDALDRDAVLRAVLSARPEVIVHQMTALGRVHNLRNFDREFADTNRLRTEATQHLLDAAREAGTRRIIVQSYTGWTNVREGGRVKTERDPFDAHPLKTMVKSLAAMRWLEATVTSATDVDGVVLRYGSFYGPGTSTALDGDIVALIRKRQLPLVGDAAGVWSFIHIDDAAEATRLAIEGRTGATASPSATATITASASATATAAAPRLFNIVDDDPAEASLWIPELARVVGAPPPRRLPAWIVRLLAGEALVLMMTEARGASNALAKRVLGWQPAYASWREGFQRGLADTPVIPVNAPRARSASASASSR